MQPVVLLPEFLVEFDQKLPETTNLGLSQGCKEQQLLRLHGHAHSCWRPA